MNNFLITFRSHPNEKHLNEEFLSLLDAKLQKSEKYIIGEDDKGTLAAHYHVVMPVKGDISHAKQVFNTKSWKMWKGNLKDKMTNIENALDIQQVKNDPSDHDLQYTIGYSIKQFLIRQKGYTNEYLKQCCDYYWINSRQDKKKIDKTWKIVNTKTAHAVIEDFCTRTKISIHDDNLILHMNKEKIYLDVSIKTQDRILASLRHCHFDDDVTDPHLDHTEYNADILTKGHAIEPPYASLADVGSFADFIEWKKSQTNS